MSLPAEGGLEEDMRDVFIHGEARPKPSHSSESEAEGEGEEEVPLTDKEGKPDPDSTLRTETLESEEEEITESITETESSSSDAVGDADRYAAERRIPSADVNLDTQAGFSTGMTGTLEAEIQKFRAQEKKLA